MAAGGAAVERPGSVGPAPEGSAARVGLLLLLVGVLGILVLVAALWLTLQRGASRRPDPPSGASPPVAHQDADSVAVPVLAQPRAPASAQTPAQRPAQLPARPTDTTSQTRAKYEAARTYRDQLAGQIDSIERSKLSAKLTSAEERRLQRPESEPMRWNYWLENSAAPQPVPRPFLGPLPLRQSNRLQFRLSTLDLTQYYPGTGAIRSSAQLVTALQAGVDDDSRSELLLDVLSQAVDPKLLRLGESSQRQTLRIDLERARAQLRLAAPEPRGDDEAMAQALAQATLAAFNIEFAVLAGGVYDMSVVIVDAASGYPLQTMVVTIAPNEPWPNQIGVRASGDTIFSSRATPSNLSLHLIELESRDEREVISKLFARLGYQVTGEAGSPRFDYLTWRTDISLAGMSRLVEQIRSSRGVASDTLNMRDAGSGLGRRIFSPLPDKSDTAPDAPDRNLQDAEQARRIIHNAAAYPADQLPPSMVVTIVPRMRANQAPYSTLVLPLGVLGVEHPDSIDRAPVFLGERFALSLTLARQASKPNPNCADSWFMAIPDGTIEGQSGGPLKAAIDALQPVARSWLDGPRQPASLCLLRDWLRPGAAPSCQEGSAPVTTAGPTSTPDRANQVFVYLGHHDKGGLYLDPVSGRHISVGDVRRTFGSASVAILDACNSAVEEVDDGTMVGVLAERGVAATVATTSTVSGELAAAYLDCLGTVLRARGPMSIGQAQALTMQCLWDGSQVADSGLHHAYANVALKYLLIGDQAQRICAPPAPPAPTAPGSTR